MLIDVVKRTPKVYSEQSRDYQVLARLYSALFNVSKLYTDNLEIWNNNIDNKLATLRSRTVNFIPRYTWDLDDLDAVTACFKYLMRRKGMEEALEACINILMKVRKISSQVDKDTVIIDAYQNINIYIEDDTVLLGVVDDLVRYLIPAGMTYRIYTFSSIHKLTGWDKGIHTDIYMRQDDIEYETYPFNRAMLIGPDRKHTFNVNVIKYRYEDSEGNRVYKAGGTGNEPPTPYERYITNTFIYTESEGSEAHKDWEDHTPEKGLYDTNFDVYVDRDRLTVQNEVRPKYVKQYDSETSEWYYPDDSEHIPHRYPMITPEMDIYKEEENAQQVFWVSEGTRHEPKMIIGDEIIEEALPESSLHWDNDKLNPSEY